MPCLLELEGVSKVFRHNGRALSVLRNVNLSVEAGEMLSVVGASGAGKSTLLHIMGTLDTPSAGALRFDGCDTMRLSQRKLAELRNRSLGFVFQFHHLLPEFTALENVMMPGLIGRQKRSKLRERGRELLREVGLSHRVDHRPPELSGGEQQRVALARALLMEPRLVLADEPTGNLDSTTSDAIHEQLFELNARLGISFIVVTHSRDLAARMPRVVEMRDGEVLRDERRLA